MPFDEGFFAARDGLRLFTSTLRPLDPGAAPAHVALVHGYGDHLGRQLEVSQALASQGYVVHRLDVRGHGQSGGVRGHVNRFDDYLSDLDVFLARVRGKAQGKPLVFVGHSHGCLIGARYLLDHPEAVTAAVFSSPFFRLKLAVSPLKLWAARLISRVLPAFPMSNELLPEQLTRDLAIQEATRADPLYLKVATPRWFTEASKAQEIVLRRATEFITPLLVLAGSLDPIADPLAAAEFEAAVTAKTKAFKQYEGLLHELFHEPERAQVFGDVLAWLAPLVAPGARP